MSAHLHVSRACVYAPPIRQGLVRAPFEPYDKCEHLRLNDIPSHFVVLVATVYWKWRLER